MSGGFIEDWLGKSTDSDRAEARESIALWSEEGTQCMTDCLQCCGGLTMPIAGNKYSRSDAEMGGGGGAVQGR